nr:uncharacterized protein LOC101925913 [Macaca fascicularis]
MKLTVSGQVFLEVGFRDRGDQRPELLCPNGIARFFDADRKGPGPGAYNLTHTCFAQKGRSGDQVMLQQMSELSPRWTRWRRENSLAAALRTSARLRNSMVALTKCMVTAGMQTEFLEEQQLSYICDDKSHGTKATEQEDRRNWGRS